VESAGRAGGRGVIALSTVHKLWDTGHDELVLLCCSLPYPDDDTVTTGR
jgi:hypothetical protein